MSTPRPRNRTTMLIVTASAVAAALILVAIIFGGRNDEESGALGAAATTLAAGSASPVSVTFLPDAAHEQLPAAAGCDQLAFHSAMAMWNPALADEMLAADCPFPFEPESIDLSGGAEDPTIDAPFEPRPFQQIFDLLTAERAGICAVARLGEESVQGFVWGFEVKAQSDGCAENQPDLTIRVREYATRAHRDQAANELPAGSALVLGRWAIELDGASDPLRAGLVDLGAAVVA
jgi:hypothetical protein